MTGTHAFPHRVGMRFRRFSKFANLWKHNPTRLPGHSVEPLGAAGTSYDHAPRPINHAKDGLPIRTLAGWSEIDRASFGACVALDIAPKCRALERRVWFFQLNCHYLDSRFCWRLSLDNARPPRRVIPSAVVAQGRRRMLVELQASQASISSIAFWNSKAKSGAPRPRSVRRLEHSILNH